MKRFKNILFVVNPTEPTPQDIVAKVQNLARINKAKVTLLAVKPDSLLNGIGPKFWNRFKDLIEFEEKYIEMNLNSLEKDAGWADISVFRCVLTGKDFIAIIGKVLRDQHDLVVKARQNGEQIDHLAMRLFRKCPCPVYVIQSDTNKSSRNVIGAVDVGASDEEERLLNIKIIELASSLALRENSCVHFVHAWRLEHEQTLRGPRFKVSDEEINKMKMELKESREKALHNLLKQVNVGVTADQIHIQEGLAQEVIQQKLEDLEGDVLVMGTVARTGLPGLLIGNKAEEVLTNVRGTVLAVKPNGFQTPVRL